MKPDKRNGVVILNGKLYDNPNFLNNRHSNIKFTTEKQINHSIACLDVFISGISNQNFRLQTYHKSTYTRLLLNLRVLHQFHIRLV